MGVNWRVPRLRRGFGGREISCAGTPPNDYFIFFWAAIFSWVSFSRNFTIFLIKLNGNGLLSGN